MLRVTRKEIIGDVLEWYKSRSTIKSDICPFFYFVERNWKALGYESKMTMQKIIYSRHSLTKEQEHREKEEGDKYCAVCDEIVTGKRRGCPCNCYSNRTVRKYVKAWLIKNGQEV